MKILLTLAILALPATLAAQPQPQVQASPRARPPMPPVTPPPFIPPEMRAIESSRLDAATRLMAVVMPPARIEAMVNSMMGAMATNMSRALETNPDTVAAFSDDPKAGEVFRRFMDRMQAQTTGTMRANMPEMMTAMTRAYARRFTVAQMAEMQAFFATPTGQFYMDQAPTIMSDPDVAAWQRKLMSAQFARMPAMMKELEAEMKAIKPKESK